MQNREAAAREDDEALLFLLLMGFIFSVLVPVFLMVSPSFVKEGPLLTSLFVVAIVGPNFLISLTDLRFLLAGILSASLFMCNYFIPIL